MIIDNDTKTHQSTRGRRGWLLKELCQEWVLQLALFCAVVTALVDATTSIGGNTIS